MLLFIVLIAPFFSLLSFSYAPIFIYVFHSEISTNYFWKLKKLLFYVV